MLKALAKKIAAFPGIYRLPRHLNRYRPAILMYHGLTKNPEMHDWTQVDLDDFTAQMKFLREHYRPVPLLELAAMVESSRIEPHTVAVTFDDGYRSNYDLAYPVLKEMNIPATIFVTSGFVRPRENRHRYLWPDFITALVKSRAGTKIDLGEFKLGQFDLVLPRNIITARNAICEKLKAGASTETDRIVSSLYDKYGDSLNHDRFTDYQAMTPDQIKQLAADRLIAIGAHSRTHPILSQSASDSRYDEIVGSQRDLEEITGGAITAFAYPNGRRQDINQEVVQIVSEHFACAVMTESGLNRAGHHKYLLRRIGIGRNLGFGQFRVLLSGAYYIGQKPLSRLDETGYH